MSEQDQFHRAARDGNLELLREATRKDCNSPDEDGMTPTLLAAHCGNLEALRLIVGRGGDPDKCDYYGNTALHCAAGRGHLNCLSFLVNFGCNLWAMDNDFYSAKDLAANNQKEEILRYLDALMANHCLSNPKGVEKMKEKATKDAEKRIKNFAKLQKKATKRAEKDERYLEKQRQKMAVNDAPITEEMASHPPSLTGSILSRESSNQRKDSRLLYTSPKFSDIVNTASSTKKGLGAVSKKVQLRKLDSGGTDFKVRETEVSGKKSVRSLSGLRRDNEVMYVPKEDAGASSLGNPNRRHMKDVFDGNSLDSQGSSLIHLAEKPSGLVAMMGGVGGSETSSIFERPGFGSVAFRNSLTSTLFSLPSMSVSEQDLEEVREDQDENGRPYDCRSDSIGSAGSLQQRQGVPVPWDQLDLNMDDDETENEASPLILFLSAHGLIDFVPIFTRECVDLESLMLLTEDDLKELGLQLGPRKKLLKAINTRKATLNDPGEVLDSVL